MLGFESKRVVTFFWGFNQRFGEFYSEIPEFWSYPDVIRVGEDHYMVASSINDAMID
ncbi:MAG TPA: hypothetical protein VIH42_04495 [Thermoguttaceae bacterium]